MLGLKSESDGNIDQCWSHMSYMKNKRNYSIRCQSRSGETEHRGFKSCWDEQKDDISRPWSKNWSKIIPQSDYPVPLI